MDGHSLYYTSGVSGSLELYQREIESGSQQQKLEAIVNGAVVQPLKGVKQGKTKNYTDKLELPNGGWVAARAYGDRPMPRLYKRFDDARIALKKVR